MVMSVTTLKDYTLPSVHVYTCISYALACVLLINKCISHAREIVYNTHTCAKRG